MHAFTDNPIETVAKDKFGFKIYVEILQKTLLQTGPSLSALVSSALGDQVNRAL